jgi:type I site-specific restriction endonuclease
MYELNLPTYDFRVKKENGQTSIFDDIRKKFVALTPEEWVRQHVMHFLIEQKHYPASLINVEVAMTINTMSRRADMVCYDSKGNVLLVVECKAPQVKISQTVFEQIAQYNMMLKSRYLLVTNGLQHFICKINHEEKSYKFLQDIPDYNDLQIE